MAGAAVEDRLALTAQVLGTVRRFVEREVMPVASRYEHADEYPQPLVERMKELGLFGATIPAEYGGLGLDYPPPSWTAGGVPPRRVSPSGGRNNPPKIATRP